MIIPPEQLTEEALHGILESYIVREGTDYGARELELSEKIARLMPQVMSGEIFITYDEATESVNLVLKKDLTP